MESETPIWLNEDFLMTTLKSDNEFEGIKIKSFTLKYGVPKGCNYTSTIYRVKIDYYTNTENENIRNMTLIVKAPKHGGFHDNLDDIGIIAREVKAYELAPKLYDVIADENRYMLPKCYPSIGKNILVMEDLTQYGYKMADRIEQLDFDHSKLVMENLAIFHAATVKLCENDPKILKEVEELLFTRKLSKKNLEAVDPILGKSALQTLAQEIKQWPELEQYSDKLYKLSEKIWELQFDLHEVDDNDFNVIIHGDLWTNNILIKYSNTGKPEKIKLLDLQVVRYANPAFDILYFVYTSIQYEVIKNDYDKLLKIYLENLNKYLEIYGSYKRITEDELYKMIEEKEIFGFLTSCCNLPFTLAENEKFVDLKDAKENSDMENNVFRDNFKSKHLRRVLPKHFEIFSKKKWFKNL